MTRIKLMFLLLTISCYPVFSQQLSLNEIDREEFGARYTPFDNEVINISLKPKQVKASKAPQDILLDGEWQIAEGGNESERLSGRWEQTLPANVPGSVHTALWKAGVIPDPYFGKNDTIAEKQSYKTWWYKKEFAADPRTLNKPQLVFGGIANKCTVWLNGAKLGNHEGMFGGPSFDVDGLLKEKNILIVKLNPIPLIIPEGSTNLANESWKNTVVFNCVYGWHYSKIPSLGIWRSVKIKNQAAVEIENPFIATKDINGKMSLNLTLKGTSTKPQGKLIATVLPDNFTGKAQSFEYAVNLPEDSENLTFDFTILDPQLWWPNRAGKQNLYKLQISFIPKKGVPDFTETTFGIRTIEMQPLPGGPYPDKYNWTFVINGKPMFVKGTGWCTMDPLMDFSRERYDRLLSIAKQQNIQMLRAWGSGMPETDDFYELCDRYGIMIIQEWPTAWNSHTTQPFDVLEETVRLNTIRIRNHPSLAMYGGGNESNNPFGPSIDMMGRLSIELDGTRAFHRGAPWGGSNHNYNCWWGIAHLNNNLNMTSPFWGEFGIASLPQMESVLRYLPESEKGSWPPMQGGSFIHHTPVFGRSGDMEKLAQYSGYVMPNNNMENFVIGSQLAQVVAVRHTLERARTRWPESTGALYYKMNDNYPAASWSCVDWYGAVKPLHYFVQNSFEPLASVILFNQTNMAFQQASLPVFLLDDMQALKGKEWKVRISCYDQHLQLVSSKEFEGNGDEKTVNQLGTFDLSDSETNARLLLFVSEIVSNKEILFRTFYFMNFEVDKGNLFKLPQTSLKTQRTDSGITITNTGDRPAVGVTVKSPGNEHKLTVSQNYFWLNPQESKTVTVNITENIEVDCWNIKK